MKKTVLAAALGIVSSLSSLSPSYGQGFIAFNNRGTTTDAIVLFNDIEPLGSSFTAGLFYQFSGGPLTVSPVTQSFNPALPGYFTGPVVQIPGYVSGPISFIVVAYNGADYASSSQRGNSLLFTLLSIATGSEPVGEFGPGFRPFCVCIPEPGTVALVGLGLISLLIFRRQRL